MLYNQLCSLYICILKNIKNKITESWVMGCIKQGQVLKVGLSVARPGLDQVVAAEQWHCLPGSLEGPHSFQRQAFPSSSSSACALMSYHCCPNTFSWQPKLSYPHISVYCQPIVSSRYQEICRAVSAIYFLISGAVSSTVSL